MIEFFWLDATRNSGRMSIGYMEHYMIRICEPKDKSRNCEDLEGEVEQVISEPGEAGRERSAGGLRPLDNEHPRPRRPRGQPTTAPGPLRRKWGCGSVIGSRN